MIEKLKEPTDDQREIISAHRLRPDAWLVAFQGGGTLEVVNRRRRIRRVLTM